MKAQLANYIALDLGSNKIAAIAAYIENNGDARVLAQHTNYSEGLRSGVITDLKQAENSIASAIYNIEKDCDKNIEQAAVSLSGAHTKSFYIYHKCRIPNQPITKNDVGKLIANALSDFTIDGYDVIHYFPIEFTIDEYHNVQDPIGMIGSELGVRIHIVAASSNMVLNLINCMSKCHIEVTSLILGIYASGRACLTEDEQNLGSVIIDIGAKTTSYGIFFGKKLIYTGHIPVGGWHITSDITKAISVNMSIAEKLKVLYGSAIETQEKNSIINLDDLGYASDGVDNTTITTALLAQIISPRVEEILELVKAEYDKIGVDHLIARRIVLTGGGAMLRGLKECAAKMFEKQVRLGKPVILPGFAEDHNPCAYSTSIGMVKIRAHSMQMNHGKHSESYSKAGVFSKMIVWLKENI